MTSKLTRERIELIANFHRAMTLPPSHDEIEELARMALAAMDSSESVELPLDYLQGHKDGLEWAAQLAEANHPETGDWLYDDPIELAKAIRKGPDMPPAQSVDSEPVAWTWQHREQWHVTNDEERARDLTWDGVKVEPLYRHAQQPVVPGGVRQALSQMDDEILAELKDDESRQEGIRKCIAALGYHHRRAGECSPGYAGSSLEEDTLTGIDFLRGANRAAMLNGGKS